MAGHGRATQWTKADPQAEKVKAEGKGFFAKLFSKSPKKEKKPKVSLHPMASRSRTS